MRRTKETRSKSTNITPLSAVKRFIAVSLKKISEPTEDSHKYVCSGGERRYKSAHIASKKASTGNKSQKRYNPKQKQLWKDKKVIAGTCVFAAALTVILSVSIPGEGNNIYTSNVSPTYSSNASDKSAALETPGDVQPTSTVSPGTSDIELALLQQNGFEWLSSDFSGGEEEIVVTPAPSETESPEITPSDSMPTPTSTTEPEVPELVPGCNDQRIIEIQQRLMDLGYMEDDETTDYYGWGTEYSLQLFQRKHGLQIDGLIGDETLSKLFSDDAVPYTVKPGDRGTDVEILQDRLKELKYLKTPYSGYYGTDTEKAVKSFQKRNGLSADGTVGENTREALFSEDAKPAAKPSSGSSNSSGNSGGTGGTGSSGPVEVGDPDQASVDKLIEIAESLLGSKYVRGGKGPNTFDCSGFVYYCLNKAGYNIGYMTSTSWATSSLPKISDMYDLKPGDIICYSPHHVAIYIGNGQMIDASSGNGKVVKRSCTSSYWKSHFRNARRVF